MTPEMQSAIRDFCSHALKNLGESEVVAKSTAGYCIQVLDELAAAQREIDRLNEERKRAETAIKLQADEFRKALAKGAQEAEINFGPIDLGE